MNEEEIEFSQKIVQGLAEEIGLLALTEDRLSYQLAEVTARRQKKQEELWKESKHLATLREYASK